MKVGGGWHGAQPWGLVGVDLKEGDHASYQHAESKGLPGAVADEVICTRYNDTAMLERTVRRSTAIASRASSSSRSSARAGSCRAIPRTSRPPARSRAKHGSLLIFDEVIAGFRFRAGAASGLYGIRPDLATFAKAMGGGMPGGRGGGPGRRDGPRGPRRRGQVLGRHLLLPPRLDARGEDDDERTSPRTRRRSIPRINALGEAARRTVEEALRAEGFAARCTGRPQPGPSAAARSARSSFPYNGSRGHQLARAGARSRDLRRGARRHGAAARAAARGRARGARARLRCPPRTPRRTSRGSARPAGPRRGASRPPGERREFFA